MTQPVFTGVHALVRVCVRVCHCVCDASMRVRDCVEFGPFTPRSQSRLVGVEYSTGGIFHRWDLVTTYSYNLSPSGNYQIRIHYVSRAAIADYTPLSFGCCGQ